tara:strand:- start:830 stop:1135 length:306 start_codon:yes stop_codon:yes gene_type:complete
MKTDLNYLNACGCEGNSNMDGKILKQTGRDVLDTVQSGAYDIFDMVKSTGEFVVDEAKEGYETVKEQGVKLDEKERVIKSIPNSYIIFGAIGLLIYSITKN